MKGRKKEARMNEGRKKEGRIPEEIKSLFCKLVLLEASALRSQSICRDENWRKIFRLKNKI
jgi:hypothetical protein